MITCNFDLSVEQTATGLSAAGFTTTPCKLRYAYERGRIPAQCITQSDAGKIKFRSDKIDLLIAAMTPTGPVPGFVPASSVRDALLAEARAAMTSDHVLGDLGYSDRTIAIMDSALDGTDPIARCIPTIQSPDRDRPEQLYHLGTTLAAANAIEIAVQTQETGLAPDLEGEWLSATLREIAIITAGSQRMLDTVTPTNLPAAAPHVDDRLEGLLVTSIDGTMGWDIHDLHDERRRFYEPGTRQNAARLEARERASAVFIAELQATYDHLRGAPALKAAA